MGLIRLLLALVVAGDHFTVVTLLRAGITKDGIQQWVYLNAGFAVMYFYVISGFLISYALSNKYAGGGRCRLLQESPGAHFLPLLAPSADRPDLSRR